MPTVTQLVWWASLRPGLKAVLSGGHFLSSHLKTPLAGGLLSRDLSLRPSTGLCILLLRVGTLGGAIQVTKCIFQKLSGLARRLRCPGEQEPLLWDMCERKDLLEHGNISVHMEIPCSHYKGSTY